MHKRVKKIFIGLFAIVLSAIYVIFSNQKKAAIEQLCKEFPPGAPASQFLQQSQSLANAFGDQRAVFCCKPGDEKITDWQTALGLGQFCNFEVTEQLNQCLNAAMATAKVEMTVNGGYRNLGSYYAELRVKDGKALSCEVSTSYDHFQ